MKTIRKALIFTLILLGLHYAYLKFINSDNFLISNIKVSSDTKFLKEDVFNKLEKIKGENIWKIDLDKLSEFLQNDARVSSVNITKKLPNTLKVEVEGKKPYIYIVYKSKIYVGDEKGSIFAYWQETDKKDLIVVNIKDEKDLTDLIYVIKKMEQFELKKKISSIFKNSDDEIKVILSDGTMLKTSKYVESIKYEVAGKLYKNLKSKNLKIDYIDLRFKDYIIK